MPGEKADFIILQTPEAIARRLTELVEELRSIQVDQQAPRAWRLRSLRYLPFLQVLAKQRSFAEAAAAVPIDVSTKLPHIYEGLANLLMQLRLPLRNGFDPVDWINLLYSLRILPSPSPPFMGQFSHINPFHWEVQLVYPATTFARVDGPLVAEIFQIEPSKDETRSEAAARIRPDVDAALRRFLPRAKERREDHPFWERTFSVRLLTNELAHEERVDPDDPTITRNVLVLDSPRLRRSTVSDSFQAEWQGQRIERVLKKVLDELLNGIEQIEPFAPAAGRRPEAERLAHWWEAHVFRGLTPAEIALEELPQDPDGAIDLEMNVVRRFYEVGISPVRK